MKDSNVNDIFQNDASSNNKTKTILLLTIVAIILISVFLIIAWVMTRDNSTEAIATENPNTKILNQNTIPYAYNEENNQNPNDRLGLGEMSTTPPLSLLDNPPLVQDSKLGGALENPVVNPILPETAAIKKPDASPKIDDLENDPKYIAALQNAKAQQTQQVKQQPQPAQKQIPQNEPKVEIKPALDPTKTKTPDSSKKAEPKKEDKSPAKVVEKPKPQENNKDNKQVAKPAQNDKPAANKAPSTTSNDNIIAKTTNTIANNGKPAVKGHYIQVGSFEQGGNIDKIFLSKLSKYPYRIKTEKTENKTTIKYLIGPYNSKTEATGNLQKFKTELNPGAFATEVK